MGGLLSCRPWLRQGYADPAGSEEFLHLIVGSASKVLGEGGKPVLRPAPLEAFPYLPAQTLVLEQTLREGPAVCLQSWTESGTEELLEFLEPLSGFVFSLHIPYRAILLPGRACLLPISPQHILLVSARIPV